MKIQDYFNVLKNSKLFQGFSDEELNELFSNTAYSMRTYSKDSFIHTKGDQCETFDLILCGNVSIQRIDIDGNILNISDFLEKDTYGCNLIFAQRSTYPMNIISRSDSIILHLSKDFIVPLCMSKEQFLLNFLACISDKTSILTDKINTISLKSARKLVLHYLKNEYRKTGSRRIILEKSKKELAESLGIQRTSLSRELAKMKKEGLVDFDSKSITILDDIIIK